MKKTIIAICDIVLYIIVYVVLQGICVGGLTALMKDNPAMALVVGQAVSAILTIIVFAVFHWTYFGMSWLRRKPYILILWIYVFALGTVFPTIWLTELSGVDMPEQYKELFKQIMSTPLGYVCVSLIVPVAEEVLFRGAILRRLLDYAFPKNVAPEVALNHVQQRQRRAWTAIAISALLFATLHGNLAQGIHAFVIGLFLGWLFYKTGSILPGLIFHWVNNTAAVVIEAASGLDDDAKVIDYFGGNATLMYSVIAVSTVVFIYALWKITKTI